MLTGTYARNLDRKGRVVIPADCRRVLGSPFVITRAPQGVLLAVSRRRWELLANRNRNRRDFAVMFTSGAMEVDPCPVTGRISLPQALREYAGLMVGGDVILAGMGDGLLLCRAAHWSSILADAERSILASVGVPVAALLEVRQC